MQQERVRQAHSYSHCGGANRTAPQTPSTVLVLVAVGRNGPQREHVPVGCVRDGAGAVEDAAAPLLLPVPLGCLLGDQATDTPLHSLPVLTLRVDEGEQGPRSVHCRALYTGVLLDEAGDVGLSPPSILPLLGEEEGAHTLQSAVWEGEGEGEGEGGRAQGGEEVLLRPARAALWRGTYLSLSFPSGSPAATMALAPNQQP